MRGVFNKLFGPVAQAVEIHSKIEWLAKSLFFGILFCPPRIGFTGFVWQHKQTLEELLSYSGMKLTTAQGAMMVDGTLWSISGLIFFFLAVKGLDLFLPTDAPAGVDGKKSETSNKKEEGKKDDKKDNKKDSKNEKVEAVTTFNFQPKKLRFPKDEEPHVIVGDMVFTEKDLYTSCLITGVTGTGKTSAAVFPMLEQIFSIYNEEGDGNLGNIGGLCLDVKGEFFEGIIYYMHKAGRNVFEDIQVIRPNCLMPILRLKDPETGYHYYLNAKPCSSGAEAWDLIRGKKFNDGSEIPLNLFTFPRRKLEAMEPKLKEMVFDMSGKKPNYLGWRWQGERMVRVTHTPKFNQTHVALKDGKRIIADAPKKLVYDGISFIDNALRYNIVEPHKPAPEAAQRLNLISTLAEGEKQTGENAYWYKRARAHIGSCIELWRLAYEDTPQCTAQAIYKITQQDDYMKKQVKIVEQKIKGMQDEAAKIPEFSERISLERDVERMTSIVKYFTEEWGKYDSKTKTIVGSVVANAFDTFNKDPVLQDSFCQPKTFSFEECINDGKIYVLVAGDEYETVAKVLGTALKMDFQSTVLSRMHRSELNQKRKIMLVNDECQKFVVAGGSTGAGDENFMSLCRQSKCFNINATQADSWIISVVGKENSDVYLQNYNGRIWFRTNDKETAEKAEQLCGIKKQKSRTGGSEKPLFIENLVLGEKGAANHAPTFTEKEEEKPRYPKDKFYNLEKWECIIFNGTRTGSDKACQSQCEPANIGSEEGAREVREVMKLYFQGYLENLAYKQNGGKIFDPVPEIKNVTPATEAETLLPPAETTTNTTIGTVNTTAATTTAPIKNEEPKVVAPAATQNTTVAPKVEATKPVGTNAVTVSTATTSTTTNPAANVASSVTQAARSIEAAPVAPPAAVQTSIAAVAPVPLEKLGDAEAFKTRAKKLLKSVQVIPPKVCDPTEGSRVPFETVTVEKKIDPVAEILSPVKGPIEAPVAPITPAKPKVEKELPVVDKNFKVENVTPQDLTAAMEGYKESGVKAAQEALKEANFIPPNNPMEYLPLKRDEESAQTDNPILAAERAALGPKGKQGGNPIFALARGGAIQIPNVENEAYERAREQAVKEERDLNARAFIRAVGAQAGPMPDVDTMELLKNLKPEIGNGNGETKKGDSDDTKK